MDKKLAFIFSVLLIPIVNAVEVVQNADIPQQLPKEPSSAWIWYVLLGTLLLVLFLGLLVYIIYRIVKWLKTRESEFHQIFESKRALARVHASKLYYRSLLSKSKNAPINCMYKDKENKIKIVHVGFYYGHFYSNEGTLFIAFANSPIHFLLWFIPKIELIMVNKNPKRRIKVKEDLVTDKSGKEKIITKYLEVELPTNIEHFQDDQIILYCYGIDNLRTEESLFAPVLFNEKTGEILPTSLYMYAQLEGILLQDVLFTQSEGYSKNTKKAIEFNTSIKASQKLSDTNSEVSND